MSKNVSLIVLLGALAVVACRAQQPSPQGDSESHWLRVCGSSSECDDAECLCGVCSRSCSAQSECGKASDAQCMEVAALGQACAGASIAASEPRICLARCDADATCASHAAGLTCVAGACVGSAAAPPTDAGHNLSADAAQGHIAQGATTDAAASTGTSSPADAAIDATVDGGRGDAVCSAYVPEATASPTHVHLVNSSFANIYIGSPFLNCGALDFTLATDDGTEIASHGGSCANTCFQMQQGRCPIFCEAGCSQSVTQVAPGGSYDVDWAGTIFSVETMPAQCYGSELCMQGQCLVERTPPETLTVRAQAYPQFTCNETACTTCTPDASGRCTIQFAATVTGTPIMRSATWTRGQTDVSLEF